MGFDDPWDDYPYWNNDISSSGVKVLFVDPGNGINKHPAIRIQEYIFLMTSQRKRRDEPGYLEIPEGDGGLDRTSFLNLNQRFDFESCTIIGEWRELSIETMDKVYDELERLHPDIEIVNRNHDDDYHDYEDDYSWYEDEYCY